MHTLIGIFSEEVVDILLLSSNLNIRLADLARAGGIHHVA